jgi:hypothetical protein
MMKMFYGVSGWDERATTPGHVPAHLRAARAIRLARASLLAAGLTAIGSIAAGCGSGEANQLTNGSSPTPQTGLGPTINQQSLLDAVQGYQTNPKFKQVSTVYPSGKDLGVDVVLWISPADAAADYLSIDPDVMAPNGPGVFLPEGTILIRVAYMHPSTDPFALTILAKGPPGSQNAFGDWIFVVTDPTGKTVLPTSAVFSVPDGGADPPLFGAIPGCHTGCHENQRGAINDFLFGVKKDAQIQP